VHSQDALVFVRRPRLPLGLDVVVEKIKRDGLERPNFSSRLSLRNRVRAAFD
jgi:hypothetical protein